MLSRETLTRAAPRFGAMDVRDKRNTSWRAFMVGLAPIVCAAGVHAQPAHEDRWGWNYCPPPYPPACVENKAASPAAAQACAKDVERYVAFVFAYRDCKARDLERAISEANRVVSAFKCRTDKKACAPAKTPN